MASTSEIRRRIGGVRQTQKITHAMYLISQAKLRKAKQDLDNTRPYFQALQTEIGRVFNADSTIESRYVDPVDPNAKPLPGVPACLLITADKGLAGAYNQNAIRQAQQLLRLPYGVLVVCAGQSLVRRDQQARRHAGQGLGVGIHRIHIPALYGAVRVEHAADLRLQCLEIRPCVVQILFGLPQLRLGDQIHGVGDLLGLPYASDAPADLTGAGHALTARLRA